MDPDLNPANLLLTLFVANSQVTELREGSLFMFEDEAG
jgi:hypothetical protein